MAVNRIFYLSASGLCALYCDGGEVTELGCFAPDADGIAAFGEQLRQAPDIPSALLVDLVEEEFRSETVPHLQGGDRHKLLARKMATLFRVTPFRSARVEGRDPADRRRDRVLFTALTRPEAIEPWLAEVARHKVPLAGVYSLAMLAQWLVKRLDIRYANALLLTIQQGSLLRQSFCADGVLKISRLTPLSADREGGCVSRVLHEVDRNQRYLGRLQLLTFGKPMDVVVISGDEQAQPLRQGCHDSPQVRYHFVDINEVARKVGLRQRVGGDQCERCFAWLLSRHLPASNYAPAESRTYYRFYNSRRLMVAASVVVALAATLWSVASIHEGQQLRRQAVQVEADTRRMGAAYEAAVAQLPSLPYAPRVMAAAVEAERQLARHKPQSLDALAIIGRSLSRYGNISLDGVQWSVVAAQEMAGEEAPREYEVALIKAHLRQFPHNYQAAFEQIERFMAALEGDSRIQRVEALRLPLEVTPASSLTGESQRFGDRPEAGFELKVWLNDAG